MLSIPEFLQYQLNVTMMIRLIILKNTQKIMLTSLSKKHQPNTMFILAWTSLDQLIKITNPTQKKEVTSKQIQPYTMLTLSQFLKSINIKRTFSTTITFIT